MFDNSPTIIDRTPTELLKGVARSGHRIVHAGKESVPTGETLGSHVTGLQPDFGKNLAHNISARDGSWATGPIGPGESGSAVIGSSGEHEYFCTEHPWTSGQLLVE